VQEEIGSPREVLAFAFAMASPERSPLKVLERITGKQLSEWISRVLARLMDGQIISSRRKIFAAGDGGAAIWAWQPWWRTLALSLV
jgi:hypothetical protein